MIGKSITLEVYGFETHSQNHSVRRAALTTGCGTTLFFGVQSDGTHGARCPSFSAGQCQEGGSAAKVAKQ